MRFSRVGTRTDGMTLATHANAVRWRSDAFRRTSDVGDACKRDDSRHFRAKVRADHATFTVWSVPEKPNFVAVQRMRYDPSMATKAQEAVDRLWEITRHLSQGAAGAGSIFSIEKSEQGDQLLVTINESPGVGRRYALEVSSHRKVRVDNQVIEAEENVEGHQARATVGQEAESAAE